MLKPNIKQESFINEYMKCGNATKAAAKAGYSRKTAHAIGSMLLKKFKPLIDERIERKKARNIAKADEVLEFFTQSMRGKIKEQHVVVEGTGQGYSEAKIIKKQIAARDRLRAAEQLAKRYGLLVERVDITSDAGRHLQSIAEHFEGKESEVNLNDDIDLLEDE